MPWNELRNVPTAIVTGSNGKTTTVRLLAACARAHGWRDGYNCTDGLFVAGEQIERGDYSGPVGTRTVLRDTRVAGCDPRNRARRNPAARARGTACARRRRHERHGRSLRRVRHRRPEGPRRHEAGRREHDRRQGSAGAQRRRSDAAIARRSIRVPARLVLAQLRRPDAALTSHEGRFDQRCAQRAAHRQLGARQRGRGVRPRCGGRHAAHRRRHRRLQRAERRGCRAGCARSRHSGRDRRNGARAVRCGPDRQSRAADALRLSRRAGAHRLRAQPRRPARV